MKPMWDLTVRNIYSASMPRQAHNSMTIFMIQCIVHCGWKQKTVQLNAMLSKHPQLQVRKESKCTGNFYVEKCKSFLCWKM